MLVKEGKVLTMVTIHSTGQKRKRVQAGGGGLISFCPRDFFVGSKMPKTLAFESPKFTLWATFRYSLIALSMPNEHPNNEQIRNRDKTYFIQ